MSARVCKLRKGSDDLSPLQVNMLRMAAANRRAGRLAVCDRDVDLYFPEIFVNFLGWPLPAGINDASELRKVAGTAKWSVHEVGRERYRASIEEVGRAMFDLHSRGMLVAWQGEPAIWMELTLTDQGLAAAEKL